MLDPSSSQSGGGPPPQIPPPGNGDLLHMEGGGVAQEESNYLHAYPEMPGAGYGDPRGQQMYPGHM